MNPVADSRLFLSGLGIHVEPSRVGDSAIRQLEEERLREQALFLAQTPNTTAFLQAEAGKIAAALTGSQPGLRFHLPPEVVLPSAGNGAKRAMSLPPDFLEQNLGGMFHRGSPTRLRTELRKRLADLEQSRYAAVTIGARLIRFSVVHRLVYGLSPECRPDVRKPARKLSAPATLARKTGKRAPVYFMPEWVVIRDGRLSVDSIRTAEERIAQMQTYLGVLHLAVSLAPYMFSDPEYQVRRNGMLGQLVAQSQSLAEYQTGEIVGKIRHWASEGRLDMGLSLSIPFFDDQTLEMELHDFPVIPGRTRFVPAFVALAARREQARVAQETRWSQSTRIHLVSILKILERAFAPAGQ
jgi:hypothetical protein